MKNKEIDDHGNPYGETPDERKKFRQGRDEGLAHAKSSPETLKKFDKMTEELTNIKLEMAEQKSDIKYIKEKLDSHIEKEGELPGKMEELKDLISKVHESQNVCFYRKEDIDKALEGKSGKWVEVVLKWVLVTGGTVLVAGVGKGVWSLIELIVKK